MEIFIRTYLQHRTSHLFHLPGVSDASPPQVEKRKMYSAPQTPTSSTSLKEQNLFRSPERTTCLQDENIIPFKFQLHGWLHRLTASMLLLLGELYLPSQCRNMQRYNKCEDLLFELVICIVFKVVCVCARTGTS